MKKTECKSIYDLAKISGVSYATVSRVLNGHSNISESARDAVLKAADEYNFKPKMKARKRTIGIAMGIDRVLNEGRYGYLDTILLQLLNKLSAQGLSVEFFSQHNIASLQNSFLDGLVCAMYDERIAKFIERMPNLPVITINMEPIAGVSRVYSDHEQSGRIAAEYLMEKGHQRAGIILDSRNWGNELRLKGFRKAFAEKGFSIDESLSGYINEQSEIFLVKNIISANPTAIFLAGEDTVLPLHGMLKILCDDRNIPMTLISMENPVISKYINPPLTTVAQPLGEIVDKVIDLINSRLESGINEISDCCLDNKLIVRGNDIHTQNS